MRRVALAGLGGLIGGCAAAVLILDWWLMHNVSPERRGVLR